ncbi:MAG: AAA family ATPase [Actinomycetota bacterium]|nr:AAA family ATPase [Actinomycetota bacterium]
MLERLIIHNFKRFERVEIELGDAVVFIGPNNSGKTSALQALALWELGVRRWHERRGDAPPRKRPGVTLNRRDLVALPVPEIGLLWRGLHARDVFKDEAGKQHTKNVRIDIEVHGVTAGRKWTCGVELDYANPESLYCRPLGWATRTTEREAIPPEALEVRVAYLPPMSGLAANELRLDPGAIQVRLGEGRTAEVLRNLCYALATAEKSDGWSELVRRVRSLFGVTLARPEYVPERGELTMSYTGTRHPGVSLDLSSSGRGLQQVTLLLAYLIGNPGAVLLLDEPDAHLEILRQAQIYATLTEVARATRSQVIAASHSEVILNEAADKDIVIAFVGPPHRIDDRGSQLLKALKSIGFDDYYQAETAAWVLYLEGATDLAILQAFAKTLDHPAAACLARPFVRYIANQPKKAQDHFFGLREARPDLVGIVLTDNLGRKSDEADGLPLLQWSRREIESYLCFPEVLEAYAGQLGSTRAGGPLFADAEAQEHSRVMRDCVAARVPPAALRDRHDRWWRTVKATDDFLDPVFEAFFAQLGLPNLLRKSDYHVLATLVPRELIDPEVPRVLDEIQRVAASARHAAGDTDRDGA